jgi:hypothetical protein
MDLHARPFIASALLCLIALEGPIATPATEPTDPFKPDSVWRGECSYEKTDYAPESKPFAMILYIKQRKAAEFQGTTWYPTQDNSLLSVTGQVGEKGEITFTEVKLISRTQSAQDTAIVPGMKFTGRLEKGNLKGSGNWTGPAFNGPIRVKFSLRLAH